jgi:hypothetical protein
MFGAKDSPAYRLILAGCGAVLVLSLSCNVAFAWRSASLQRQVFDAMNKLQKTNQSQQQLSQQINAIAQDLVNLAPQHPWLVPILQKYGLARANPPAPAAPQAAPKK